MEVAAAEEEEDAGRRGTRQPGTTGTTLGAVGAEEERIHWGIPGRAADQSRDGWLEQRGTKLFNLLSRRKLLSYENCRSCCRPKPSPNCHLCSAPPLEERCSLQRRRSRGIPCSRREINCFLEKSMSPRSLGGVFTAVCRGLFGIRGRGRGGRLVTLSRRALIVPRFRAQRTLDSLP